MATEDAKTVAIALAIAWGVTACASAQPAHLQPHSTATETACEPANGREGQPGCWVLATAPIEPASAALFWHVYDIGEGNRVGDAVDRPGTVIAAHGRRWLVKVAADDWTYSEGRHVTSVGPLELLSSGPHTASFMEATFVPGMSSRIHTHPGPEAWVVLEGEQCLETPEGIMRGGAGDAMTVRGGIPMQLFGTGSQVRKALVLILHPQGHPLGTPHHDWKPTGDCVADRLQAD